MVKMTWWLGGLATAATAAALLAAHTYSVRQMA